MSAYNPQVQVPKIPGLMVPAVSVTPHLVLLSNQLSYQQALRSHFESDNSRTQIQSRKSDYKRVSRFSYKDGQCVFTPREEQVCRDHSVHALTRCCFHL